MPERDIFAPQPVLPLGKYRHYKGGEYEVLALACNEATHEWLVVYKALYDTGDIPSIWVRTYADFTAKVATTSGSVPRFTHLGD